VPIREIDVEQLRDARARGEAIELLDVRSEGEHALVRLDPCRLVPLHELHDRLDELDDWRGARVVVYCHHGIRSRSGAAILMDAGFRDVVSLRGGIDAWSMRVDPNVPRY
jgi:adenylyltransferase/sulfurtransferase